MPTMDIFDTDAFSVIELTRALENIPYKPATLTGSGLFADRGVRSRTVVIESRDGTLSLIPFSERGSAYEQQIPERRDVRAFVCRQFKKQDVLWARADATAADVQAVALLRGPAIVNGHDLVFAGTLTQPEIDAAHAALAAAGILVR